MVAFAGNSLLCRAALAGERLGPVSFTALRVGSGALVLGLLVRAREGRGNSPGGSWGGALSLFTYALGFSLAYLSLDAGTGALLLFAAVQLTMMGASIVEGERPSVRVWAGSSTAIVGLIVLLWPGVTAPDPLGALLMVLAGVGWGVYSLLGRGATSPLSMTAGNFARALPLAVVALGVAMALSPAESPSRWEYSGIRLALASGAVTSGLGYALWYRTLRDLDTNTAAVAQLSVPVLAALGGAMLLGEALGLRLALSAAVILVGIALVSTARPRAAGSGPRVPES
jgi:drug/metabolite transporter (DMT)-like permease